MDQAARGKKALADGNYEEAITQYTAALKSSPTSPDYLIQRSTALQRAKQYAEALIDASNGLLHAQKRAKRELIIEAQFRRGCALYSLERYGDAEFVFGVVKRMDEKHKMVPTWLQKNKMALDKLPEDDERRKCNVVETPSETETAAVEQAQSSSSGAAQEDPKTLQIPAGSSGPAVAQQTQPDKIRHEWYQNNEKVYFTLLVKGVPKDKAKIDIQERSLSITFPLASGTDFSYDIEPLFGAVLPAQCTSRILTTKLEITLIKATPGQKWSTLESSAALPATEPKIIEDDAVKQAVFAQSKAAGPSYPTSSKSGPKDWDKITKNLTKTNGTGKESSVEDDDDYEGGDEANHFFKKLFKGADPDTQRAMMKSYTESNGTALSTNWAEVGKGPVETLPPDGMEAKKW